MTSQEILPENERLKNIDLLADIVDIEYCIKYHKALLSAELRIKELEAENTKLKDVPVDINKEPYKTPVQFCRNYGESMCDCEGEYCESKY